MLSIQSGAAMAHALSLPINTDLKCLLRRRVDQLGECEGCDLGDLARFVIVQAGDDLDAVEQAMGFSPLVNVVDGCRYGHSDFTPSWEWIEDHRGWFEAAYVLTDDGFGVVLMVEDAEGVEPALLALCREYADQPPQDASFPVSPDTPADA